MIINTNDELTTGVVDDIDVNIDYSGATTDTVRVTVNNETKKISAEVRMSNILDSTGTRSDKAYPAILGKDAMSRADSALKASQIEKNRASQAESEITRDVEKVSKKLTDTSSELKIAIDREKQRAIDAEKTLQEKIAKNDLRGEFGQYVEEEFAKVDQEINRVELDSIRRLSQAKDDIYDTVNKELIKYDKKIVAVSTSVTNLEKFVDDTYAKKIDVQSDIEETKTELKGEIDAVKNLITQSDGTLVTRVEALELSQNNLRSDVEKNYVSKFDFEDRLLGVYNNISSVETNLEEQLSDLEESIENSINNIDLSEYAKVDEVPKNTSELINDSNFVTSLDISDFTTKIDVEKMIAEAELSDKDIDLSEYAKKEDIPDVSDFISEIPSEYITETELSAKKYTTSNDINKILSTIKFLDGGNSGSIQ